MAALLKQQMIIRAAQWCYGTVAVLQRQPPGSESDHDAVCTDFLRSPCGRMSYLRELWFPPTQQGRAGL